MPSKLCCAVWAVLFAIVLGPQVAMATTIDPLTWEQLVLGSDFVGVVECTQAGGVVARYRVVERWGGRGPQDEDEISIRVAVNYWGPQFPTAFVGDQYLVTAYRNRAPSTMMSTTGGGGVPLWFRSIPSDYRLPLFQGRIIDPEEGESFFDSEYEDFDSFRAAAKKLLGMDQRQREAVLLRVLANKYLLSRGRMTREGLEQPALNQPQQALADRLDKAASTKEILETLLTADPINDRHQRILARVLIQGGGELALRRMEEGDSTGIQLEESMMAMIAHRIRKRLESSPKAVHSDPEQEEPTDGQTQQYRKAFAVGPGEHEWNEAFTSLTIYDPKPVADWLREWVAPVDHRRGPEFGYALGSYFAWKCGVDRIALLTDLADHANDDYIRVAAAVYLCFDNEDAGTQRLRELLEREGDPGVWSALTLVRRGDKSAMPRALRILAAATNPHEQGRNHRNLRKRMLVLLSNSCATSGVPLPRIPIHEYEYLDDPGEDPLAWWQANRDKITISDPWLPMLIEQKVD